MDSITSAIATELLSGLNDAQREAVLATSGPVLVVAGPGSGKTRVLTHRIAYLMEVEQVPGDRILAVTFTNKAAREMRARIEQLRQGRPLDGITMGTFHAFGARLLRENPGIVADRLGIMPQFSIYDDADQIEAVKAALKTLGLDPKLYQPRRLRARISAAKSQLMSPDEARDLAATYDEEVIARVYREYERLLRRASALDFDDLLTQPINLFEEAPHLLERYQERFLHVMVDEYQDTNRVQYVMVSALAERHRNLFVVGDPDQSIYGWRQADIRNILDFEKDYPDARQIHLELNYRSTARIVEAADRVIRENVARIDRRLRTENDDGEHIVLRELTDQGHEAQFITDEIRRLAEINGVAYDDVAVMYRTTAQSRAIEEALRFRGIPYQVIGGVRFYERKEIKDILATLRLLHNPADSIALERVVGNLPIGRGLGPRALEEIRTWAVSERRPMLEGFLAIAGAGDAESTPALSGNARAAARRVGSVIASLRDTAVDTPLTGLFDAIVERTGYGATFDRTEEEDLDRWANLLELRSELERLGDAPASETIAPYLERVALVADVDSLDTDERGRVTLITLHSAKGLEFPVVFVAGVEEGLLPISRAVESEHLNPEELEEERRLFYVGMTRAKRLLYLTYASSRATYGRFGYSVPSRFLQSIPDHLLRSLGRRGTLRPGSAASLRDKVRGSDSGAATPEALAMTYEPGQTVFHPKFGEGRVIEASERRGDQEVAVNFVRHGTKRLLASLAAMDVID
ncbi:MAG TPA: UvrD-helicase domain-containing protein [Thermomicrobiales bacterium]|nr:UvrD-helicase domain-containing protein [Thermomicrobiales bacterium]